MRLRHLELKDAPLMLEWMHDKSVVKDLNTNFGTKTIKDCTSFIEGSREVKENLHLAIVDDSDEYMGTISLKHIAERCAEFGIAIRTVAMGKGYAREAMDKMLEKAFSDYQLDKVYWCVDPKNERALRFYDKNGYKRVSFEKLGFLWGGYSKAQIHRFIWYQIAKEESGGGI
nr:GNAT family N-acetyltransferase [uncultured Butyrivibrio sp.]